MFVNVRKALKRRSGFSLLEMLAVAVVIGVLALIAVPAVLNAEAGSQDAACDSNRDQIINAFTTYKARTGNTITSNDVGTVKNYLVNNGYIGQNGSFPKDPADDSVDYTITVTEVDDNSSGNYGKAYSLKVDCTYSTDHGEDVTLF